MVLDKEQIQKQAKQLLDKFALALEEVDGETKEESYVDREEFERQETTFKCADKSVVDSKFKQKLLQNAPQHDDDLIIAEKGSWK